MRCVRLPRGAAWISISLSSGSASFASRTSHSPPPNSVWNTVRKFSRTLPNDSRNSAFAVWSISRAACCNEWRAATRSSRCVRPGELRVRLSHLRFGVARGGVERANRETALLQGVLPLRLLGGERRGIVVQGRDLLHEGRDLAASFLGFGGGARRALPRSGEARVHLGRIHLPLHALLPRRFLFGLELDQALPLTAQALVEPHSLHVVGFDLAVQRAEPGLHFRQARRPAPDLARRV